jgi:glycosyltransferase involved in cell wall biosynthesis
LAAALADALARPDLLERGAASLAFAKENYDWKKLGFKYRELYEAILKDR